VDQLESCYFSYLTVDSITVGASLRLATLFVDPLAYLRTFEIINARPSKFLEKRSPFGVSE
jgi:hypothetical protein